MSLCCFVTLVFFFSVLLEVFFFISQCLLLLILFAAFVIVLMFLCCSPRTLYTLILLPVLCAHKAISNKCCHIFVLNSVYIGCIIILVPCSVSFFAHCSAGMKRCRWHTAFRVEKGRVLVIRMWLIRKI